MKCQSQGASYSFILIFVLRQIIITVLLNSLFQRLSIVHWFNYQNDLIVQAIRA
jgi:hypothetical protein